MKPIESPAEFNSFAEASGIAIKDCTPAEGLNQMFSFYECVKPQDCNDDEGDMLLFQWGTCDWGSGKHFELNITRQFIESVLQDDDAISQLSLTFKYEPTNELESAGSGNRWCSDLAGLDDFRAFIFSSASFLATLSSKLKNIELSHSYV